MTPSTRVLRVIPTLDPEMGGPQTTIVNAAIAERRAHLEPTIVFAGSKRSLSSTAPARARLKAAGIETLAFPRARGLPSSAVSRWGISRQMSVWLFRNVRHFDIVHVDYVWAWSTLIAAIAGSRARRPVVMTAHESLTSFDIGAHSRAANCKKWAKLWMRGIFTRYVDLIVMTSKMEYADSVRPEDRAVVIPHAVVADPADQPLADPPTPPFVIGYIGRLHPKKNIEVLLRAVAALETPTRLIICGEGSPSYSRELHLLADELSLTTIIEWWGHVDPAGRADLFAHSHVVAMPSAYECFGMAAAESLAAGVPVVVSKTTGVAPIVEQYECGKLVEAGEVDELRAALAEIACDKNWRRRARTKALRAVSAAYSYDSYSEQIAEAYAQLLS